MRGVALARPAPAPAETPDLEHLGGEELLAYMVERFHPRLYVACSFQKEASVILHMLLQIEPEARFFTLDTGVLFPETYETWREIERRYGVTIDGFSGISLGRQAALHGEALWSHDPDRCCEIRKVRPMREALASVDGWVAGLRRDQSPDRAATPKFQWDPKHGLWKANPIADWTERDVWRYINEHDIPYHPLHDQGYASIGCTHCTSPGEGREGRWAGTDKIECGLHAA
jgi:phosphoadenosine phosphosulfate reductase